MSGEGVVLPAKLFIGPPAPAITPWLARAVSLCLIIVIGHWVQVDLGGVKAHAVPDGKGGADTSHLFNWHPVLMTLAFGVFMAEALMSYQAPLTGPSSSRLLRKKVHAGLQSLALVCALVGVTVAFKSHSLALPTPLPNLYSAHSWLGFTTLLLLAAQFAAGLGSYLWPGAPMPVRVALGPIHKFGGRAVWVCGLAAMAMGLQEKATFIQKGKQLSGDALYGSIMRLPAVAALLVVALAVLVLYQQVPAAKPLEEVNKDSRQALLSGVQTQH